MEERSITPKPQVLRFASQTMLAVFFPSSPPLLPHVDENNWFFPLLSLGEMVELSFQQVCKTVSMLLPLEQW